MKKLPLLLLVLGLLGTLPAQAQFRFNDTMLFNILKIRDANGTGRYLMEYQAAPGTARSFTGKMVLSLCSCYCDSIWDAWPPPSDSLRTGGKATLTYASTSSNGGDGPFGSGGPNRQRGLLNIWQMPGSFTRSTPFSLPVIFTVD